MSKRKIKTWVENWEGQTSRYSLWSPYPFLKNGLKVARVTIWCDENTELVTAKHLEDPDYREFYETIKSPGSEYIATDWYYCGTEDGYHLYSSKEIRDKLFQSVK